MTIKKISLKFVLILILLDCQELYAQIRLCNLNTAANANNICRSYNYLVYISESVCEDSGVTNCWCILVDNRNREYDGQQLEIEMDNSYRATWMRAIQADPVSNSLELKFTITPGINQIYVEPYTSFSPIPNVISFKIDDHEVCNSRPKQQIQNTQDDYRFLNDCMQSRDYTANSERFCENHSSYFIIEKRFFTQGERYWCIIINNKNNVFSSANRLMITYTSHNKFMAWTPSDVYLEQNSGDSFTLGSRRTVVAVSKFNGILSDLATVTIDGQSICNYFQPILNPPPRFSTMPYKPAAPQYEERLIEPPNIPSTNCGIIESKIVPLIAFGEDSSPGDWPWHAAIYKHSSEKNRTYNCGGTLIDRKTIITAAHCIVELGLAISPDRIIVELGRFNLSMATPDTQEFKVFDVIPHELYNPLTQENDIGILILANFVQLTAYVNFICLPEPNMNLQNQIGTTVGWGRDENNQPQVELQQATLPVIDNMVCLSSNRNFFGQYLTNTNFCAGYRNKTNVCIGDSGGGLVFERDNHWILGGITSFAVLSNSTELPCDLMQYSLFTDVTKFVTWIKQNSYSDVPYFNNNNKIV